MNPLTNLTKPVTNMTLRKRKDMKKKFYKNLQETDLIRTSKIEKKSKNSNNRSPRSSKTPHKIWMRTILNPNFLWKNLKAFPKTLWKVFKTSQTKQDISMFLWNIPNFFQQWSLPRMKKREKNCHLSKKINKPKKTFHCWKL